MTYNDPELVESKRVQALARDVYSELTMGIYVPEEMGEDE